MGRAIVRDPQVFLFDEPLSNLDAKLRVQMRTEIKELHQRLKTTTIYVTHDQIEAMTMADKIVVMHDGLVEQIGAPLELYDRPGNLFVAGFIGSPAMNFLHGTIRVNGAASFRGPGGVKLPLATAPAGADGRPAVYGIRPEHFAIADDGAEAEVQVIEPTGSETQVVAKLGGEDIIAVFRERHQFKPGDKIRLKPDPKLVHLFDEATGQRLIADKTNGGTTMTTFTRRALVKGGTAAGAAGALTGPALLDWAKAWAQAAPWKPEKGAKLSMLRWKYFVQSEDDAFVKLIEAFTKATGVQGRHLARVLRGRAAEGVGRRQHRHRPGPVLGPLFAAASVPAEVHRRHRRRRLSRQEIRRLGAERGAIRQERQQVDRDPDLLLAAT